MIWGVGLIPVTFGCFEQGVVNSPDPLHGQFSYKGLKLSPCVCVLNQQ